MGGQQSQPIQLTPGPGFQKRKANTFPGYENIDFGGYEIWGPYKKVPIPGAISFLSWEPKYKTVDWADLLTFCTSVQQELHPEPGTSGPSLLRSIHTPFSVKPNVGTDNPACYQDNTFIGGDDGLFYIHYKHPAFARIIDNPAPTAGFSGLIPTLLQGKSINKAKSTSNIYKTIKQRPLRLPTSIQNAAEAGYLLYKGQKTLNRLGYKPLPFGIQGPLDLAVYIINTRTGIFNLGKRTLNGGSAAGFIQLPNAFGGRRKHLRKLGTRKRKY